MKTPMGEMTMVNTPDNAFMIIPGMGTRDVPAAQRDNARAQMKGEMLTVLKNPENYVFAITGSEKVGDVNATVLTVSSEGDTAKWYVDPSNGKLLRKASRSRNPMMQGDQLTEYTAWGTYGGLNVPTATTITLNGDPVGSGTLKTFEVNPTVDAKAFDKPAATP
jgi:hypothetical protein